MIDFNEIKALVAERDAFLAEHPELQELQDHITKALSQATNIQDRNRILQELMLNSWFRITEL